MITQRWQGEGGYRQILALAVPLILSSGSWAVQHFVDRMFLAWYSPRAIAAAMPAGVANFAIMSVFLGIGLYVSTFVAQYSGAGRNERIGPVLWQGIYMALIAAVILFLFIPLAEPMFRLVGHDMEVQQLEVPYFQILCLGTGPLIASMVMAGFFTGRKRPWPVMWVNVSATCVNIFFNYVLIFGHWGFPKLGVKGAALGSVLSAYFSFAAFLVWVTRPRYRKTYRILSGWRPDPSLFWRLLRFGLPNGVQFFLGELGFAAFILLVGRIGMVELAATNITMNIETLAFMPMIGFGMAVSVLVGQNLGRDRPDLAERSIYSGFHLTFLYMASIAGMYVLVPGVFIWPFAVHADPVSFAPIENYSIILLRFVAVFCIFDTLNIIFASGIKGAGDTRFVMIIVVVFSLFGLALPTYVALAYLNMGLFAAWTILTSHVIMIGLIFLCRFLGGKWKSMRVIEAAGPVTAASDSV
ncbi:MAG: MATE family efflux transporter [Deltaproteobacteria bacterium]|nr:MATE family efflux transporter [Deltaproteobacteria bacterium]MBW2052702.1 MATE family efflux transporter [Deltaproteobacteria bacterium]MBW2140918.1 MATE family efflux transporter [Deltaproteobacteria bacterium]